LLAEISSPATIASFPGAIAARWSASRSSEPPTAARSIVAVPVSAQTVGVVLMHGNTDSPSGNIALLAEAMEGAGYMVERPEMCWSHRRMRDRPFLECLAELDAPIARLTGRGARTIVVAGMSVGGAGALAFGARRSGLAGIIALAPNGAPERLVRLFPQVAESVAQARAMVDAGQAMNAPASPT
jgi:esterase/lipase